MNYYDDDDDNWDEPDNRCSVCKEETDINADGVCFKCAPLFYAGMDVSTKD